MNEDRDHNSEPHECHCYRQRRHEGYSFTELLVPILAGFSLPTVIIFAADDSTGKPYHDAILSLLIAATTFFLASIQLTSDVIKWDLGGVRGFLTLLEIWAAVVALFLLGKSVLWQQSTGKLVLIVLLAGDIGVGIIIIYLWIKEHWKQIIERDDGQVIAIEIKASSRISGEDFRGLRQLKERLGPRLEDAIILHTGEHAYTHDDWITVLPLDRLWAPPGRD